MTPGPSSAAAITPSESPMLEKEPEPEYARLHYMDVDVKKGEGWTTTRGLVDGGSQGNCIQEEFSRIVPTTRKLKTSPTTMIMADGNQSPPAR